jgi:hypothetical protein
MSNMVNQLKYSFYLTTHPFKGFYDIKHEKRGSLKVAIILLIFYVLTSVADGFYCGFLFNPGGGIKYNVYQHIAVILLVYFLWCISNWCLTSLFEGEGSLKDIFTATAYALLPISIAQIIMIPLSNSFSLQDASFYNMILYIGLIWSAFLLVTGTIVTHQYTLAKTIIIIVFIFLGMCIITYIMLLFFNLIQQILGFAVTFWRELMLRFS